MSAFWCKCAAFGFSICKTLISVAVFAYDQAPLYTHYFFQQIQTCAPSMRSVLQLCQRMFSLPAASEGSVLEQEAEKVAVQVWKRCFSTPLIHIAVFFSIRFIFVVVKSKRIWIVFASLCAWCAPVCQGQLSGRGSVKAFFQSFASLPGKRTSDVGDSARQQAIVGVCPLRPSATNMQASPLPPPPRRLGAG